MRFSGNFTQQEPISEEAIATAVEVMRHGRLHRYNLAHGEVGEVVATLFDKHYALIRFGVGDLSMVNHGKGPFSRVMVICD